MTKSESNLVKTLILNKRWETGSLNKKQRKDLILNMIRKELLTEDMQVTKKGHTKYLNCI